MERKKQIRIGVKLCRIGMELLDDAKLGDEDVDDEIMDLYNMYQRYGSEALDGIEEQMLGGIDDEQEF